MSCLRALQKSCSQLTARQSRSLFHSVLLKKSGYPAMAVCPVVLNIPGVRHNSKKTVEKIPPYRIGVTKGQTIQHTGSLFNSHESSDRLMDDIMIRKYVEGVFYELLLSDILIKRKDNRIFINIIVRQNQEAAKVYFLVGFSEKLLTELFGCVTKFEVISRFVQRRGFVKR